jgi:hypothetical protein
VGQWSERRRLRPGLIPSRQKLQPAVAVCGDAVCGPPARGHAKTGVLKATRLAGGAYFSAGSKQ